MEAIQRSRFSIAIPYPCDPLPVNPFVGYWKYKIIQTTAVCFFIRLEIIVLKGLVYCAGAGLLANTKAECGEPWHDFRGCQFESGWLSEGIVLISDHRTYVLLVRSMILWLRNWICLFLFMDHLYSVDGNIQSHSRLVFTPGRSSRPIYARISVSNKCHAIVYINLLARPRKWWTECICMRFGLFVYRLVWAIWFVQSKKRRSLFWVTLAG